MFKNRLRKCLVVGGVIACISSVESTALQPDQVWISIGTDVVTTLNNQSKNNRLKNNNENPSIQFLERLTLDSISKDISIVSISAQQLDELSIYLHDNYHRCGGYIYHGTKTEAIEFTKNAYFNESEIASSYLNKPNSTKVDYTINNGTVVNEILNQITPANLSTVVDSLASYNNRYYSEQSGVDASNWIKNKWENIAEGRSDINVKLYNHDNWIQPSVIATITGTSKAEEVVVIGGHLDSINGSNPRSGRAPGVDDNASGIAVITETLSAIVASGYKPARTIKIMGYAAEEVGLRGSNDIAREFKTLGVNVVGVAQFDMTGFRGTADKDFVFISDYTSNAQNQFMAQLIDVYFPTLSYSFDRCGYACSDHASWTAQGYPASMPFESSNAQYNSDIHTTQDNHYDVEHSINFAKLSVAYVAELAKGNFDSEQSSSLQFVLNNVEIEEQQNVTLQIERTGGIQNVVSVDFKTVDASAVAGVDYVESTGTLTWEAGDAVSQTIVIQINDVSIDKSFNIVLSNPTGGALIGANNDVLVTIKYKEDTDNGETPDEETQSSGGGTLGIFLFGIILLRRFRY